MTTNEMLLYGGGAVAAYLLFFRGSGGIALPMQERPGDARLTGDSLNAPEEIRNKRIVGTALAKGAGRPGRSAEFRAGVSQPAVTAAKKSKKGLFGKIGGVAKGAVGLVKKGARAVNKVTDNPYVQAGVGIGVSAVGGPGAGAAATAGLRAKTMALKGKVKKAVNYVQDGSNMIRGAG